MAPKQRIQDLLSTGAVSQVIDYLRDITSPDADLNNRLILLSGRNHKNDHDYELGLIDRAIFQRELARISYALTQMLNRGDFDDFLRQAPPPTPTEPEPGSPPSPAPRKDVFISYSHRDTEAAMRVKTRLEAAGVTVEFDGYGMEPGINVYEYIRQAIAESRFTLALISENSLLSTWVVMETLGSFEEENVKGQDRFIPCCLDKSFLDRGFMIRAAARIDEELKELEQFIEQQNALKLDSRNFNEDKSRLYELRNQLDNIIGRLKRTKCANLGPEQFEASMQQVIDHIKASRPS